MVTANAPAKGQKPRQGKRTIPKKITKGIVGNVLADFIATLVFVFASSTFGEVCRTQTHLSSTDMCVTLPGEGIQT